MTFNPESRTHGLRSTYSDGCKCGPCREAARAWSLKHQYDECPTCGRTKYKRSKTCATCRVNGPGILTTFGPIRAWDASTQANPAWRPPHYPPACEACNGWGYTTSLSRCPTCRNHPGHACSHEEWMHQRA